MWRSLHEFLATIPNLFQHDQALNVGRCTTNWIRGTLPLLHNLILFGFRAVWCHLTPHYRSPHDPPVSIYHCSSWNTSIQKMLNQMSIIWSNTHRFSIQHCHWAFTVNQHKLAKQFKIRRPEVRIIRQSDRNKYLAAQVKRNQFPNTWSKYLKCPEPRCQCPVNKPSFSVVRRTKDASVQNIPFLEIYLSSMNQSQGCKLQLNAQCFFLTR